MLTKAIIHGACSKCIRGTGAIVREGVPKARAPRFPNPNSLREQSGRGCCCFTGAVQEPRGSAAWWWRGSGPVLRLAVYMMSIIACHCHGGLLAGYLAASANICTVKGRRGNRLVQSKGSARGAVCGYPDLWVRHRTVCTHC